MNKQTRLFLGIVVAAAVGVVVFVALALMGEQPAPTAVTATPQAHTSTAPDVVPPPPTALPLPENPQTGVVEQAPQDEPAPAEEDHLSDLFAQIPRTNDGDLQYGLATKRFLDSLLDSMDYRITDEELEVLKEMARLSLPGQLGEQTVNLLESYVSYRNAEKSLLASDAAPKNPMENLEQMSQLRRLHFGEEIANKMYAEEEARARYFIQSFQLAANQKLSQEEREEKASELSRELVANVGQHVSPETLASVRHRSEEMRKNGMSESDIYTMQVEALGSEKAEELQNTSSD